MTISKCNRDVSLKLQWPSKWIPLPLRMQGPWHNRHACMMGQSSLQCMTPPDPSRSESKIDGPEVVHVLGYKNCIGTDESSIQIKQGARNISSPKMHTTNKICSYVRLSLLCSPLPRQISETATLVHGVTIENPATTMTPTTAAITTGSPTATGMQAFVFSVYYVHALGNAHCCEAIDRS